MTEPRSAWDLIGPPFAEAFTPAGDELAAHRVYVAYERASERFCRSQGKWAANADEVLAQHTRPEKTLTERASVEEETMARPDMNERAEHLITACIGFVAGEGRNPSMAELGKAGGLTGPTDAAIAQATKKALAPLRGTRVDWSRTGGVEVLGGSKAKAPPPRPISRLKLAPAPSSVAAAPSEFGVVELLQAKRAELLREVDVIDRMLAAAKVA